MSDLFASNARGPADYDAHSIEVLEGLEPVRRRPGMYIGGTDERALHHLAAEVIDNSMDEAVASHASRIEVTLEAGNRLTVTDNTAASRSTSIPNIRASRRSRDPHHAPFGRQVLGQGLYDQRRAARGRRRCRQRCRAT
jgi:hypothetical protein